LEVHDCTQATIYRENEMQNTTIDKEQDIPPPQPPEPSNNDMVVGEGVNKMTTWWRMQNENPDAFV
jgi:hypothetical protein